MDFGAEIFTAVCQFSWNLGALTLLCLSPKIQFVWLSVSAVYCPQARCTSFASAQLEVLYFSTVHLLVHKHKHGNAMCKRPTARQSYERRPAWVWRGSTFVLRHGTEKQAVYTLLFEPIMIMSCKLFILQFLILQTAAAAHQRGSASKAGSRREVAQIVKWASQCGTVCSN